MAKTRASSDSAKSTRTGKRETANSESIGPSTLQSASKQSVSKTDVLSFEAALAQLEDSVARLEDGDMPLEDALELFEAGVKLSRQCNETLEAAERRVEVLVAVRGENGSDAVGDSDKGYVGEVFDSDEPDAEEVEEDDDMEDWED